MKRVKPGVRVGFLKGPAWFAYDVADQVYAAHGEAECVLTSGTEGRHSPGSLHYQGLAIDLRLPVVQTRSEPIRAEIAERLGGDFDVLLEALHIHIEFDVKVPYSA